MWGTGVLVAGIISCGVGVEARANLNDTVETKGLLSRYDGDYYINGVELEVGDDFTVSEDYDQNGRTEPVSIELYGLIGKEISIKGYRDHDPKDDDEIYVTEINGMHYTNSKLNRR